MSQYDPEWSIAVLKDLEAFFKANEMHASSKSTNALIATVMQESDQKRQKVNLKFRNSPKLRCV